MRRYLVIGGSLLGVIFLGFYLYLKYAPDFGAYPNALSSGKYAQSVNYREMRFFNPFPIFPTARKGFGSSLRKMLFGTGGTPPTALPAAFGDNLWLRRDSAETLTWFGHSAFLVETGGKRILLDPMLTDRASPLPVGPKRFPTTQKIPLDKIRDIDAIVLSHDHYDHLDYQSIKTLDAHTGHYYTALGVGEHLKRWGIPSEKITELDWWESANLDPIRFMATPAQHFSGRRTNNRNSTLWASWVIQSNNFKLFFSGDGGYNQHFHEIGQKAGPFDLALIECGQYNPAWKDMHLMPEESVQAGIDLQARVLFPIHWGGFKLSIHSWQDPILRFTKAARENGMQYLHPTIGRTVPLKSEAPGDRWWEDI